MADIVERWLWGDPAIVVERLEARERRSAAKVEATGAESPRARDRYYTQARRLEVRGAVRRVLRGKDE